MARVKDKKKIAIDAPFGLSRKMKSRRGEHIRSSRKVSLSIFPKRSSMNRASSKGINWLAWLMSKNTSGK